MHCNRHGRNADRAQAMSIHLRPRPTAVHGGNAQDLIDLSASLNPLGPSPNAVQAARGCELGRYPEVDAAALMRAAAIRHGLHAEQVVPVPGASWALWLCAVALLRSGDRCLALVPCFGEYRRFVEVAGAEFVEFRALPPDFHWNLERLEKALAHAPTMCVLGNPANPTGTAIPASTLRRLFRTFPKTWFVVDEAFAAFAPGGTSLLDDGGIPSNALVVRSLTKELALPGLRMGYLVASAEVAKALAGILPPWPLSAPALAAAVAGMRDTSHVECGAALARREVAELAEALTRVGLVTVPSFANYVLAHAPGAATGFREHGIAVRDCDSFGLPQHIRIAAPGEHQLHQVLTAIGGLRVTPYA